jgi:DNA topoisomerase-1
MPGALAIHASEGAFMPESPQLAEGILAARLGGLRYITDEGVGYSRQPARDGFRYLDTEGREITDTETLARIKSLTIPPAWTEVWICPDENGHLQATGRDARGRKQYRYHKQWRQVRDEAKYERMVGFGMKLPAIRQKLDEDIARPGLSRSKVIATIVRLLDVTHIRIGNEEYAQANKSFGLTTLRNRHVTIEGTAIEFRFHGKSGIVHSVKIKEPRLARIVRRMRELPGQELFQYVDGEGQRHSIGSADVNDYLQEITGEHYTAKDFRTWGGTVHAAMALKKIGPATSATEAKRNIKQAVDAAAARLGYTPAICRKCYVHPTVFDAYEQGLLHSLRLDPGLANEHPQLSEEEVFTLKLLQTELESGAL